MRIPALPLLIAVALLGAVIYFVSSSSAPPRAHFGAPIITRIGDFEGVETEEAISPDGKQIAAIVSGNLWLLNIADGAQKQLTSTAEFASFPSWSPDNRRITFTSGSDTFIINILDLQLQTKVVPAIFKTNATSLEWSPSGRIAFVRDRELWIANSNGLNETLLVHADADPDITMHSPRFSPDSLQLSFIQSLQNLKGEVWLADLVTGDKRPLVSDRPSENPMDSGWIMDGRQLVYLTDRSGAYALWTINFAENTLQPLTSTLDTMPLGRIGMSVRKDRIILPRHFVHSDIALSDGTPVVQSGDMAFEPAVSPDGKQVAYTIQSDTRFAIWTSGLRGENPIFRSLGREARFAANGYQLVFTHSNLTGNPDLWTLDLRNGETEPLTDTGEIDAQADWQPNGKTVVFASNHNGPMAIWSVPANGGPRVPVNDSGFFPRYSGDGKSIYYWSMDGFWKMNSDGNHPQSIRQGIQEPAPAVSTKNGLKYYEDSEVRGGKAIWPRFDVMPDGRYIVAPIEIRETALWAVDLTFTSK